MNIIEMDASSYFPIQEKDIPSLKEHKVVFKIKHSFLLSKLPSIELTELLRECSYEEEGDSIKEILKSYRELVEYVPGRPVEYIDILHMYCHIMSVKSTYLEFSPEDKYMLDTLLSYSSV